MSNDNPYDDDDEFIDEDLAFLENMDIDRDYNVWTSFRSSIHASMVKPPPPAVKGTVTKTAAIKLPQNPVAVVDHEKEDSGRWDARIKRTDVYSKYYKPMGVEVKEITELSILLGVKKGKKSSLENLFSFNSSSDTSTPEVARKLLLPKDDELKSIILKRGPVLLYEGTHIDPGDFSNHERELVLLTHGLIFATLDSSSVPLAPKGTPPPPPSAPKASPVTMVKKGLSNMSSIIPTSTITKKQPLKRKFDHCELLTSVTQVVDLSLFGTDHDTNHHSSSSFAITLGSRTLTLVCSTPHYKNAWLRAFRTSVLKTHSMSGEVRQRGWQHDIIRTSLHAAAVCGDEEAMGRALAMERERVKEWEARRIDEDKEEVGEKSANDALDEWGMAPLHYAADRGHGKCVTMLLIAGCNPNVMDKDMRSPLYYAEQNGNKEITKTLLSAGAEQKYADLSTELYGDETTTKHKELREGIKNTTISSIDDANDKTNAAKGVMANNITMMQLRGEKLEELGEKTTQLKDNAAVHRDLAAQLKNKMKAKNTWFGAF